MNLKQSYARLRWEVKFFIVGFCIIVMICAIGAAFNKKPEKVDNRIAERLRQIDQDNTARLLDKANAHAEMLREMDRKTEEKYRNGNHIRNR